jgi:hypothetical protein
MNYPWWADPMRRECDAKKKDKDEPPISAGSATIGGTGYAILLVNPPMDG